jgi:hypothetical protein
MKTQTNIVAKIFKSFLLSGLLFGLLTGCSDNPTSNKQDDEPIFPDFEQIQIDVSYFLQRPPFKIDGNNTLNDRAYSEAYTHAVNAANLFQAYGGTGFAYFGLAELAQPQFSDNMWNWTYTYQTQGVFTEMKLTSRPANGGHDWNLYLSIDVTGGESFSNLKIMQGFTNDEGSSGRWSLYPAYQGSTTPILEFNWNKKSDSEMDMIFKIFAEGSNSQVPIFEINYQADTPDYEIDYINRESEWEKTIYWNTTTLTGYIIEDGAKSCWNQSLEDITCN